jgi:HK97 family phage major capsid protein
MFKSLFVPMSVEAIITAIELAIFKGTGVGQMTGITVDTRVPAKNKFEISSEDFGSWDGWKKKVFAKMKKSYRNGTFIMAQSTFDGYIDGMVDGNGQPIGRVNYGIDGSEVYRFGGKEVITVEEDLIADYETASKGDVVAVFVNLKDYAINSNMEIKVVKWEDHDTNEIKNKAIVICDGKLVDPHGVLIIKKGE